MMRARFGCLVQCLIDDQFAFSSLFFSLSRSLPLYNWYDCYFCYKLSDAKKFVCKILTTIVLILWAFLGCLFCWFFIIWSTPFTH